MARALPPVKKIAAALACSSITTNAKAAEAYCVSVRTIETWRDRFLYKNENPDISELYNELVSEVGEIWRNKISNIMLGSLAFIEKRIESLDHTDRDDCDEVLKILKQMEGLAVVSARVLDPPEKDKTFAPLDKVTSSHFDASTFDTKAVELT